MKLKPQKSYNGPILCLLIGLLIPHFGYSTTGYFFFVQFKDKNNSPYSLSHPEAYLSARAIERRAIQGIATDSTDLPVNPSYLQAIQANNIDIYAVSKWMNGATLILPDSSQMSIVRNLPCVKYTQYTGLRDNYTAPSAKVKKVAEVLDYGIANTQINQVNGKYIHNKGYTGTGMMVGVLDAGFYNVNINHAFDSLRLQGRLLGTKDIAERGGNVYTAHEHGANVLSIMAGNLPGQYLGSAPHAAYWLIHTEYAPTEYLVEADFWCSGIEFADSVGVDLVNSSLGYTKFDDASMNFSYSDMTGKVCRASKAAELAAHKGIVVCNSAGNDGANSWHYIGAPADADSILTIGAVTASGNVSSFSSYGPSYDGRVKPDICGQGSSTAITNTSGTPTFGNGTSYSCPVIAGVTTCLLQAYHANSANIAINELRQAIIKSGSLYTQPSAQLGYGIANFETAYNQLIAPITMDTLGENQSVSYSYNSQNRELTIKQQLADNFVIRIYNTQGQLCLTQSVRTGTTRLNLSTLSNAVYLLQFPQTYKTYKIIVN